MERERLFFLFLSVFGFSGCDKDIQMVSLGIDDIYYLPRMKAYALHPAFTGEEYRWTLRSDGRDSLCRRREIIYFLPRIPEHTILLLRSLILQLLINMISVSWLCTRRLNIVPISRKSMNTVPRQANLSISCLNIRKVKRRRIYEKSGGKYFRHK